MTLCLAIRHKTGILVGVDSSCADTYGPCPEKVRKIYTRPTGAFVGCGNLKEIGKFGKFWKDEGTEELIGLLSLSPAEDFSCIVVEGRSIKVIDEEGIVGTNRHKFTAIGSGEDLARGYLAAVWRFGAAYKEETPDLDSAKTLAKLCFRDCARFDYQIKGPYKLVNV